MNADIFIPYATRPYVTFEVCRECYAESNGTVFAPAASCEEHRSCADEALVEREAA